MNYLFSAKTLAFYPEDDIELYIAAGSLPDDVIVVGPEVRDVYNFTPPTGKKLGVVDGMPAWVDLPPPTKEELIAIATSLRAKLRATADSDIAWRQDAVDADIATEKEKEDLSLWRKYRVLLMRVDLENPEWPATPDN